MRDGRVGQQALEIVLRERGEVRARHGRDGDKHQERHIDQAATDEYLNMKMRSSIAQPAALTETDMKPVWLVGAPS